MVDQGSNIGRVAEWLGTALQKLLLRFESARDLQQDAPEFRGVLHFGPNSARHTDHPGSTL